MTSKPKGNLMNHYTQGMCKRGFPFHVIEWKESDAVFDDDVVRVYGVCSTCKKEFERTYSNPLLTIFGKNRTAYNYDKEVIDA